MGVGPRLSCVTQEVKLTLRPSVSKVAEFIVCEGFVDY